MTSAGTLAVVLVVAWFAGIIIGVFDVARLSRVLTSRWRKVALQAFLIPMILLFAGAVFDVRVLTWLGFGCGVLSIIGWSALRLSGRCPPQ